VSDYERMQAWADAAKGHPTWSVAYAEDVPVLLAEVERLRSEDRGHALRKAESDLTLCRAEVVRLRYWLDRIANHYGPAEEAYRALARAALEGRGP
jgi:hypothetical protein